jgi:hypothetical protein
MVFLCMYCNSRLPIALSVIDYEEHGSGPHAKGFFICPDCKNKFMIKIEDLGKVGQVWTLISHREQHDVWSCMMSAINVAIKNMIMIRLLTLVAIKHIVDVWVLRQLY